MRYVNIIGLLLMCLLMKMKEKIFLKKNGGLKKIYGGQKKIK
jgi:hypothetical protein